MTGPEEMLKRIDEATEPARMTKAQALDYIETLQDGLASRREALLEEIEDES